jgi:NlpC/P60 family putative phage cell wall peptidase
MDNLIIAEVRSWIGNRWRHGQAFKGQGTDCVQWLLVLGKQFGWVPQSYKPPRYNRDWALHNNESILLQEIQKFCSPVNYPDIKVGDVLIFKYSMAESHAGIYIGEGRMVHAHIRQGVIEEDVKRYDDKLSSCWRHIR